ncbi:C-C motif chemokine 25b [Pristis pectinata]|uniref:C-C motif chemokine 25b n=1 Tax=Pristis pectinata TaxID=685728 RepID=UPI00223E53A1|nr:C-C motif chemokine 25b [Pristis pectinata]
MKFLLLTLVLMAACFYWTNAQANSFEDCCLKYVHVKHPRRVQKFIVSHRIQRTGGGCNLPAVILKLRQVSICVNPNEKWVRNYINSTEKRPVKRTCKKHPEFCKNWHKE